MPYSRLIDQFEAKASLCASGGELGLLVEDAARELGFHFFALLHHVSLRSPSPSLVRIDNYPAGWTEELVSRHLAADDPVHLASARTNTGFAWAELGQLVALAPPHRTILRRCRR